MKNITMNCISCNYQHEEKFCPNCGERNGVKRINFSSMLEDTFSSVTNMDRGFLFNLKNLMLQPKKMVTDYIEGKRKGVLNPISYLIFSVTIYLIILVLLKTIQNETKVLEPAKLPLEKIGREIGHFIRANLKYFWIFSIVPLALSLKLVFRKYNFIEYLAISSFIIGQATLIGIISFLILRFPLIFDPVVYFMIFWLSYKIGKGKSKTDSLIMAFTALVVFIILLILIIVLIGYFKTL